jgi:hypothetical protein
MASHKREEEGRWSSDMRSLDDLVPGKPCGAVVPLSEDARIRIRDRIEMIQYLLNEETIVWS